MHNDSIEKRIAFRKEALLKEKIQKEIEEQLSKLKSEQARLKSKQINF